MTTKRYVTAEQRAKICLSFLLLPMLLPAFLLKQLLVGLWHCCTYLRGHLAWRWSDEFRAAWWIVAAALSGRHLRHERQDRWDEEYLRSKRLDQDDLDRRVDRRVEHLDRRLWKKERRKLQQLVKMERRRGGDRRICQLSDRRQEWREQRDAVGGRVVPISTPVLPAQRRKSDRKHGARRKTDKKRRKS